MSVPTVIAIIGGTALLIGIFGGGIKAKEIEIPSINARVRILAVITGLVLLTTAIVLSSPDLLTPPTETPIADKTTQNNKTQTAPASRLLEIVSNQGWQSSDIFLSKGDTVHVVYQSGHWRVAYWAEFTDAQGYSRFEGYAPAIAHGALIAQIDDGPVLPILNESQFIADRDGVISFRINDSDNYLSDNVGSIKIMVDVTH
jgi:hypothetical protein